MNKYMAVFLSMAALSFAVPRHACADDAVVASHLKAIETKQDKILQELAELRAEIQKVKIRVTSQ